MRIEENDEIDILDNDHLYDGGNDEMFEAEVTLAEATKFVDKDGSIVLAEAGDKVNIKSKSMFGDIK